MVIGKIHTDGADAVDGTVTQNGGDAAFRFQGYIGKENTHQNAEQAHHGDAGEGESPIANAVVVTNDGQWCMPQTPDHAGNQKRGLVIWKTK